MSIRRIKFLKRKRIPREKVTISLEVNGPSKHFTAQFDLGECLFPADSRIYIDAKQMMETLRFDYGTLAKPRGSSPLDVSRLKGESIVFNLLVVDAATARKLGEALAIKATSRVDSGGSALPLLPVDGTRDLDGPLWKIEYSSTDQGGSSDAPVLLIDRQACRNSAATFMQSSAMAAAILPSAMHSILTRIAVCDEHTHDAASLKWRDGWIRFAEKCSERPYEAADEADAATVEQWVADSVAAFARQTHLLSNLVKSDSQ